MTQRKKYPLDDLRSVRRMERDTAEAALGAACQELELREAALLAARTAEGGVAEECRKLADDLARPHTLSDDLRRVTRYLNDAQARLRAARAEVARRSLAIVEAQDAVTAARDQLAIKHSEERAVERHAASWQAAEARQQAKNDDERAEEQALSGALRQDESKGED
jgi:hypothetical protein